MATIIPPNGFETGDSVQASSAGGTFSIVSSPTAGSWSVYALRTNPTTTNTGSYTVRGLTAAGAFVDIAIKYIKVSFRVDTLPASNSEEFLVVFSTSTPNFYFRINSSGNILLYTGGTTLKATGTATLSTSTWYSLRFKVDCNGSDALVSWDVNGSADVTNASTGVTAALVSRVALGKLVNRNSQSVDFFYDDLCVSDSAYPDANSRVSLVVPTANGTYQTWTIGAGSGSHYQVVDEVPPNGDTDYLLSSNVTDDTETELLGNAPVSISGTVSCVSSIIVVKSNSGVTAGTIRNCLYSGSTLSAATSDFSTSTSAYTASQRIYDTDPNTSAAWAVSALSSVESGARERDTTIKSRMTFTGANVSWYPDAAAGQPTMRRFSQCRFFRPVGIGSEGVTIG